MDDWCELFANQTTRKRARGAKVQGSGRIASRLKIATPGEYFVIDTGWLMDDPLPFAMAAAYQSTYYSMVEIDRYFQVSYQTVSRAVKRFAID